MKFVIVLCKSLIDITRFKVNFSGFLFDFLMISFLHPVERFQFQNNFCNVFFIFAFSFGRLHIDILHNPTNIVRNIHFP